MVQGDPGLPITIRNTTVTELDWDDAAAASVAFTLITPGTGTVQPVYDIVFTLHVGRRGYVVVQLPQRRRPRRNGDGRVLPDVHGNRQQWWAWDYLDPTEDWWAYWPASISSTTSSDGAVRTLCPVSVPAQPFDWRPEAFATCILTGTGPDCSVDLMARVSNATSGDIVSRKVGLALTTPRDLTMIPGPAAGAATTLGKIAANAGPTTIYLRAERQTGADSFSTSASTTSFYVKAVPLP